ncbi:MAG: hypothetical protein WCK89_13015 [bacterium]
MMSRQFSYASVALFICLSVGGCRKKEAVLQERLAVRPGVFLTNEVSRSYKDLKPDDVLVQVGRRVLTRQDFQELVAEKLDLQKKGSPQLKVKDLARLEQKVNQYVFANSLARAALLQEAETRGVEPTQEDLAEAENYVKQLCRQLKVRREEFAKRFAGGETAVAQRIHDEATLKAVLRHEFGELFTVSDADAASLKGELERRRQEAQATNNVVSAVMGQLQARLVSGELKLTDEQAAMQALMPSGVHFAGVVTCRVLDINLPQQSEAIAKLKPMEWSPVVELEESFDLYQLRSVTPHQDPDLVVYSFVKVSAARDIGWEVPDIAQIKGNIAKRRRTEKQAPWVRDLITKYGVLYPNGVELFKPAEEAQPSTASRPAAGKK